MKFKDLYKLLEKYKYFIFSNKDLFLFFPDEKKDNIKNIVYRWKNEKLIYVLKKGLYELTYPSDFNIPDLYIANKLYGPSYISLETALSNYSIIPQVSMAVTSITTKTTRKFKNKHGLFIYRTVKPESFLGYYVEKQGPFEILIAEPEKAFVDYLYFKIFIDNQTSLKNERIDKDIISSLNKNKLRRYASIYKIDLEEIYAFL